MSNATTRQDDMLFFLFRKITTHIGKLYITFAGYRNKQFVFFCTKSIVGRIRLTRTEKKQTILCI
jgi:hypothetical protein